MSDEEIGKIVFDSYDIHLGEIIRLVHLRFPIYANTSACGHLKRGPWKKATRPFISGKNQEEKYLKQLKNDRVDDIIVSKKARYASYIGRNFIC